MVTKENKANANVANNVKANNNASNNVNNESAKVENESNEQNASDNVDNNATDESKATSESNQESAKATAPTSEQIAAAQVLKKHETEIARDYKIDLPKEVEKTKFAGAYVLGVYRVDENKKEKKSGDKTYYKIYYSGKIYDGWHSTEFCDEIGIERKHRDGSKSTPKAITMLDKLQALKNAIEAVGSEEENFVNFAKIVADKIESEKLESDRIDFVAKYGEAIALFDMITEATFAKRYNSDDLALAKKLGYKFSDTKTTETTESK